MNLLYIHFLHSRTVYIHTTQSHSHSLSTYTLHSHIHIHFLHSRTVYIHTTQSHSHSLSTFTYCIYTYTHYTVTFTFTFTFYIHVYTHYTVLQWLTVCRGCVHANEGVSVGGDFYVDVLARSNLPAGEVRTHSHAPVLLAHHVLSVRKIDQHTVG